MNPGDLTEDSIELEYIFDDYRAAHLEPLSQTTLELQRWLHDAGGEYYIAQRLKRKPQIIRKLKRLSVRLTQLQDIGGCRIIVQKNNDVDDLVSYLKEKFSHQSEAKILKITDYRDRGRDVTGYRSLHVIIERENRTIELQIRSRVQHYWAESIERTSVIYGHHLKEMEGDPIVIGYFKVLSDIFFDLEAGREPGTEKKINLDRLRAESEKIISVSDRNKVLSSFVNEDVVKTLSGAEGNTEALINWIIVFDWNEGRFVTWEKVGRSTKEAIDTYVRYEKQFTSENDYEVVMIGSSDIESVSRTHSHYFGIDAYENILESLDQSILGMSRRMDIDIGARQILAVLSRKRYWGKKSITADTLKNHYLKGLLTFDSSLEILKDKGLILMSGVQGPVSLNIKKRNEIDGYL